MKKNNLDSVQLVQITSILAEAIESISDVVASNQEKASALKAMISDYEGTRTLRPYSRPAKCNFKIPKYAQEPFLRAISIAGNVNRLADMCHTPSARCYEVTRGIVNKVSHSLAKRIHVATNGQVKAWELNDEIDKNFNPGVDI